jgi:hypothetical protein
MEQSNYQDLSSEDLKNGTPLFRFSTDALFIIITAELDMNLLFTLEAEALGAVTSAIPISKLAAWRQTLTRKQFLTREGRISTKGAALLAQLGAAVPGLSTYRPTADLFEIWWNSYPPTATFTHKGTVFTSTQVKRIKKTLCREHWDEILLGGEYTAEQIVQGTRNHIAMAMDESVKDKSNRVHYIFNSERYIREKCFAAYIQTQDSKVNHDTIDI